MSAAIRIIRSSTPSNANIQAIEAEEQWRLIAKIVAESIGQTSSEQIDRCSRKLLELRIVNQDETAQNLVSKATQSIQHLAGPGVAAAHAPIDLERVLELLEGV